MTEPVPPINVHRMAHALLRAGVAEKPDTEAYNALLATGEYRGGEINRHLPEARRIARLLRMGLPVYTKDPPK